MPEIGNNTLKADIDLVDETFDISQSESYHLSIQTEPAGKLSFCVFNTVISKYVVLRNYPLSSADPHSFIGDCKTIFENDHLLGLKYKSSYHLWVSPRCTLVPGSLFDVEAKDSYLSFNHERVFGEQTLYHYVKPADLYAVFSCPETLTSLFSSFQPNVRFFHQTAPFIGYLIDGTSSGQHKMATYFYSHYLDVAVTENKKLLFYNTFRINTPEDSIFYLAGVANMFHINLLSTKLLYVGNTKQLPSEAATLRNYVERIVEFEPPNAVTYSHYIQESLRKSFINLFNLFGCES